MMDCKNANEVKMAMVVDASWKVLEKELAGIKAEKKRLEELQNVEGNGSGWEAKDIKSVKDRRS